MGPGQPESTCWSLVLGAAHGDRDDREAFVRRYEPVLHAYLAARWRRPADHEDVAETTQEIFLQCFRDGGALERVDASRPGGFRAFLYGIARHVAAESDRRRASRAHREAGIAEFDFESQDASLSVVFDGAWAAMLAKEARELMEKRAMASDAAKKRFAALDLCYGGGLPAREIAEAMDLRPEQVYPILSAARKEYRATFLEVLGFYHPDASRADLERIATETLGGLASDD